MTNTTAETAAFLRAQAEAPTQSWKGWCLKLQRQARGLPPVYPSALAAAQATPKEDRIYDIADARRGMVCYFDDPDDSNPWGHITFLVGKKDGVDLHWTNDARFGKNGWGLVSMVRGDFFPTVWGDRFQFAATSLNGYDLFPDKPPAPKPRRGHLGDNYKAAIKDLMEIREFHKEKGHDAIRKALTEDIRRMKAKLEQFS